MHFYWLSVTPEENREELNRQLAGPRITEEDKPVMQTEAARKIPVPSWWRGNTNTLSEATLMAERMKGKA